MQNNERKETVCKERMYFNIASYKFYFYFSTIFMAIAIYSAFYKLESEKWTLFSLMILFSFFPVIYLSLKKYFSFLESKKNTSFTFELSRSYLGIFTDWLFSITLATFSSVIALSFHVILKNDESIVTFSTIIKNFNFQVLLIASLILILLTKSFLVYLSSNERKRFSKICLEEINRQEGRI